VRYILFGRKAAVCALAAVIAMTALAAPTPADALSSSPQSAPQFNGGVYAVAFRGSTIYVGGSFTTVTAGGRTFPRQRLAAYDARSGALLNWRPTADRTVRALVTTGDSVYAAGDFTTVSGSRRDSLARLDASSGALGSFSHKVAGTTYALTVGSGRLYVGGRFGTIDGDRRGNLAAFALTSGALDGGWRPQTDDAVHSVAAYGSRVYLGGAFGTVNQVPGAVRIAAVSATSGAVDRAFLPKADAQVNALVVDGTGVYAATGGQGGRAIAYTAAGAVRWQRVFDGDAAAITRQAGTTYVGGHFDHACLTASNGAHGTCTGASVPRIKLASITATGALSTWAPQANGVIGVRVLAAGPAGGAICAGGDFTTMGGRERLRYATFR
jgi:hypothetical protein